MCSDGSICKCIVNIDPTGTACAALGPEVTVEGGWEVGVNNFL